MTTPQPRTLVLTLLLLGLGFCVGRAGRPEAPTEAEQTAATDTGTAAEPTVWTCSMHPQIRLPEPGNCPICFMKLIEANSGGGAELGPRMLQMSESAMVLARIETAPVERRAVAHEVGMVGKIAFDETRLAYITSWVKGRLDRIFVDYTGVTVREGDHLVEIYSPTLYSAQQELLQAIATAAKIEGSSLDILRNTADRTVVSAREKLRLYGLSVEQIAEIVDRGTPEQHITIRAPTGGIVVHKNALEGMYVDEGSRIYTIADLSKVWVMLDAYESDLRWLRYGQEVAFQVEAYPGEHFNGRVAFIDPVLDDRTRTVKIRLNVDNADGRLKPDMFVTATAQAVLTQHGKVVDADLADMWMCPMHPEIVADGLEACTECGMDLVPAEELGFVAEVNTGAPLVIPATAPLVTGKRAVVYVQLEDRDEAVFQGREIDLGPRAGDWYVVHSGLREGERVVVKGNFKIDSELQIRAKPSMMSPDGGARPPGHQHGGAGAAAPAGIPMEEMDAGGDTHPVTYPVPVAFKTQLGEVVDAYLQLQTAFTIDEDSQAMAQAILEAIDRVDMAVLEHGSHLAWMAQLATLRPAASALAGASDIDARRLLLAPLTEQLVDALDAFGYARDDGSVGLFHCPMALDDVGANWLQRGETVTNPYFGSAMLRCGELTRMVEEEK
ncbi:Cation efflux system protein CusB precursor [Planctomycetes bacterium Pla163]|uniref:Cation efflux system protein CusB n=1 Tax=Rohdeia mirabilis TaxID=2528008 RepID=A0A518CUN3_9BACT|nr:Cation efflux system protein CusB precursor [Planctomycetes bacterium Pla163]